MYVYNAKSSINIKFSGEKNQETYLRYTFNNYSNIDEGKSNLDNKQIGKSTSKHTLPSKMKMRFPLKPMTAINTKPILSPAIHLLTCVTRVPKHILLGLAIPKMRKTVLK